MKPEILGGFVARGDGGERGQGPIIGIYSTEVAAEEAARGKGWYGGNGLVSKCDLLKIGDDYYMLYKKFPVDLDCNLEKKKKERKKELLDNMSAFDKMVLGLDK